MQMVTRHSRWPSLGFLTLLLLHCSTGLAAITRENYLSYYTKHCKDIVPESPITDARPVFYAETGVGEGSILHFNDTHVRGGGGLLPPYHSANSRWDSLGTQLSFKPKWETLFLAEAENVVSVHGSLMISNDRMIYTKLDRSNLMHRVRPPKIPFSYRGMIFELYGFWSMSSGKLCMVGSELVPSYSIDISRYDVTLKLIFPVKFCDYKSLIIGELESLSDVGTTTFFEHVSILGLPRGGKYNYTLVNKVTSNSCLSSDANNEENLHLDMSKNNSCLSELYTYSEFFELEYGRKCIYTSGNYRSQCNPLSGSSGDLPRYLLIRGLSCDGVQGIRVLLSFSKVPLNPYGNFGRAFDPETMLVGEASWNVNDKMFYVVACHVMNFNMSLSNASIGDCSTQLRLRVPSSMNVRHIYTVEGEIVRSIINGSKDSDCLNKVKFYGSQSSLRRLGLSYIYTQLDRVSKLCPAHNPGKRKREYPHVNSQYMKFNMVVIYDKGRASSSGFSSPLYVNNDLYDPYGKSYHGGLVNISYNFRILTDDQVKLNKISPWNGTLEFFAEGTYDSEIGKLCLLGCRRINFDFEKPLNNDSMDCEVLIKIKFPSFNGDGVIRGSIKSMRKKSEPLYFEPLFLSSNTMYGRQQAKAMWIMNMDIVMALVCNSLSCVFLGLQLVHVKKHPEALPHISFVMLTILALGYMIPLLLNFEAFFGSSLNRHNIIFGTNGLHEANEVALRVITMVALLLEFRLLQLAWSSRKSAETHNWLWQSERRTVYILLPLYLAGAVISCLLNPWRSFYIKKLHILPSSSAYKHDLIWGSLKLYGGLVIDMFLLPQIVFNCWMNSTERALATSFYCGLSLARAVPHIYNFYKVCVSQWFVSFVFMFGGRYKYYVVRNMVILVLGIVLAMIIFLQQRCGGHCIFVRRHRQTIECQKVPITSLVEREMELASQ